MQISKKRIPYSFLVVFLIIVVGFWVYSHLEPYETEITIGPSAKARRNPFLAAEKFLVKTGFQVESVTGRSLLMDLPDSTDTLIVNNFFSSLSEGKEIALFEWIASGGHLILSPKKNWDARELSSGDHFFDQLGIRRFDIEADAEPVLFRYDIPGPEITVRFESAWLEYRGARNPAFTVQAGISKQHKNRIDGYHLIQLRHGTGLVTVASDNRFLTNWQIDKHDHAFLLERLVRRNPGKVWLLYDIQMPSLAALVWEHGKLVLIPLGIATLFWLIRFARRLGPVREIQDLSQRNILEQLDAMAGYLLENGGVKQVIYPNQKRLWRQWCEQYPGLFKLSRDQQIERISQFSGLPISDIRLALFDTVRRSDEIVEQTCILKKLGDILKRGIINRGFK